MSTSNANVFVELSKDSATYLLDLINEIDSDTVYTAKQRGYTVPKLTKIMHDPSSARLAYQDVDYLLELIEDDDLEDYEQIREMTKQDLLQIQALQNLAAEQLRSIEQQRSARREKRLRGHAAPVEKSAARLQEHFGK